MILTSKKDILFDFEKINLNLDLTNIESELIDLKELYEVSKKGPLFSQEFERTDFCIYIYLQNDLSITVNNKSDSQLKKDYVTKKTYKMNANNIISKYLINDISLEDCLIKIDTDIKTQINRTFTTIKKTFLSTSKEFVGNEKEMIFGFLNKQPFLAKIINIESLYQYAGERIFINHSYYKKMNQYLELFNYVFNVPEFNENILNNIKETRTNEKDFIARQIISFIINEYEKDKSQFCDITKFFKYSHYRHCMYYFLYCLYYKLISYNEFDLLFDKVPFIMYNIINEFNLTVSDIEEVNKKFYNDIEKAFVVAEYLDNLEPLDTVNNNVLTYKAYISPYALKLYTSQLYNLSKFLTKSYQITIDDVFLSKYQTDNPLLRLLQENKKALAYLNDVSVEYLEEKIKELNLK